MRLFIILLLLTVSPMLRAQLQNANLQAMVDAERAFIKMAKDENTRDAFLHFLSDDAVTTGPDGPTKGKDGIRSQPVSPGWLWWEVAFCDIAASGDMGYNTGPWEFRVQPTDDKAVAFGEFHSLWKKQPDGTWKNILDIGIRHGAPAKKTTLSTTQLPLTASASNGNTTTSTLLEVDAAFLKEYVIKETSAYKKYGSGELRLSREGEFPFVSKETQQRYFDSAHPKPANLHAVDGGVASSGDLGYVYGTADVNVSVKGEPVQKKATYLRVWKKEKNKDWKIVLDVLTYN
ncbi:nuclear transport factor 2 family protein [Chryseolinea lacunae]|uniref:Nuclear transport factor 2 family protein n=1 Tax=Chryseolinea lacunae TaxID=2801331 RepID=A0ABS1KV13_9BACT|nr:nuclear transport factor 2 family protein [Chryseolinea lacunae]MBL0743313.1 nuclear transport factor 2 family protein [Chryseolinea lacunae]